MIFLKLPENNKCVRVRSSHWKWLLRHLDGHSSCASCIPIQLQALFVPTAITHSSFIHSEHSFKAGIEAFSSVILQNKNWKMNRFRWFFDLQFKMWLFPSSPPSPRVKNINKLKQNICWNSEHRWGFRLVWSQWWFQDSQLCSTHPGHCNFQLRFPTQDGFVGG